MDPHLANSNTIFWAIINVCVYIFFMPIYLWYYALSRYLISRVQIVNLPSAVPGDTLMYTYPSLGLCPFFNLFVIWWGSFIIYGFFLCGFYGPLLFLVLWPEVNFFSAKIQKGIFLALRLVFTVYYYFWLVLYSIMQTLYYTRMYGHQNSYKCPLIYA